MKYKRIAIDTSKSVFTLHGIDEHDRPVLRRDLRRAAFVLFFSKLEPTDVALEACGGSHHWAWVLSAQGHRVCLVPPQYVKPFVKRGKSDQADAQALCEAAGRPEMATVPIKSAERRAEAIIISARDLLVRQRTQFVNAIRGHATEFGVIAGKGLDKVDALLAQVMDPQTGVPAAAQRMLSMLADHLARVDAEIDQIDAELHARAKADPVARRLMKVPSIGPLIAMTLTLTVDAAQFEDGRHFSSWLGLTPKQHSTGGKQRLGGISRAGNERTRRLLVVGAMAVVAHAKPGSRSASPWLMQLLERKPRKVAAVALANKVARVVWAMMARGEDYRPRPASL